MQSGLPPKPVEPDAVKAPEGKGFVSKVLGKVQEALDPAVPKELLVDAEECRRARLAARFGRLGSIFGIGYASFYMGIGHKWGALIILICSLVFALASFMLRLTKSVGLAGHALCLILTLGFSALCCVEGGLEGHAIAWLVSVPLCAFLLLGSTAARRWAIVAFMAAAFVAAASLAGKPLPVTYDVRWEGIVSSAGYLGLIAFMYLLGHIFETGRHQAFSKLKAALTDLAASNERLVFLNQEKNEFLGIAAHDLKSPLTVVVGCAELVGNTNNQDEIDEYSRMIVSAASRMRTLISDLLDANAIEQGKFISKVERCDITSLVRQSVEHHQAVAVRKGIEIKLGASEGLWGKADRGAVLRILDNLISNALKYSPPKTTVHVLTMPEVDYIGPDGSRRGTRNQRGGPEEAVRQIHATDGPPNRRGIIQRLGTLNRQTPGRSDVRKRALPKRARRRGDVYCAAARVARPARRGASAATCDTALLGHIEQANRSLGAGIKIASSFAKDSLPVSWPTRDQKRRYQGCNRGRQFLPVGARIKPLLCESRARDTRRGGRRARRCCP